MPGWRMSDELVYSWRDSISDDEMVELVDSHGGRPEAGWWDQIRPHSLGWVAARTSDGVLVGFVNIAWDDGDHAFLLDTKTRCGAGWACVCGRRTRAPGGDIRPSGGAVSASPAGVPERALRPPRRDHRSVGRRAPAGGRMRHRQGDPPARAARVPHHVHRAGRCSSGGRAGEPGRLRRRGG